jgi:methylase of polypeptide subunit release factors
MAIFKENLTSKILQEESLKILNSFSKNIKVLEIGCGNGNITLSLEKKANKHFFYLSDVSLEAINVLKKNLIGKKIIAKNGKFFNKYFSIPYLITNQIILNFFFIIKLNFFTW